MKTTLACSLATVAGLAAAAGFYGCSVDDNGGAQEVKGAGSGSSTDTALNLSLVLVDKTGAQVKNDQFTAKTDAYLALQVVASNQAVTSQDFLFQVVDSTGKLLSSDDLACRRFHVDAKGNIDRVAAATDASGAACAHLFSTVMINGHEIGIIQLAPFADVQKDATGAMAFKVMAAPAQMCANGAFPQNALSAAFTVKAQTATCGNGVVEAGEQCDDGNTNNGDGCSSTCQSEGTHCCGNGVLDPGEQCDDGNHTNGDGCSSTCQTEPHAAVCGNGILEQGEECDDGNTKNNDGCNAHCQIEHTCCCGNGVVDPGEQCDDGNVNDGDGCSHDCQTEGSGSGSGMGSGSGG